MIGNRIKKYIKKNHIKLGLVLLLVSSGIVSVSALWSAGILNFPPPVVYYSIKLADIVASNSNLTKELALKFHRQEHSLSCEAAALKMVLDYYGLNVSESEIIKEMPLDKTKKLGDMWGDPDKGFVGSIDGKMGITGYGIYWKPLVETASHWKKAEIIENGLAQDLVENISEGRPVIVWGYVGRGKIMNWLTPEGKKIYAINGEHVRVVYGYKGSSENPDGFLVMDPVYGSAYWEKSKFLRNWDAFGRAGVVVYPK